MNWHLFKWPGENQSFTTFHMWLVDIRDPKQLVQSWKLTFLKGLTLVITKSASKNFFTNVLFFKLRPRSRPWVKSENLVKQKKFLNINFSKLEDVLLWPMVNFRLKVNQIWDLLSEIQGVEATTQRPQTL